MYLYPHSLRANKETSIYSQHQISALGLRKTLPSALEATEFILRPFFSSTSSSCSPNLRGSTEAVLQRQLLGCDLEVNISFPNTHTQSGKSLTQAADPRLLHQLNQRGGNVAALDQSTAINCRQKAVVSFFSPLFKCLQNGQAFNQTHRGQHTSSEDNMNVLRVKTGSSFGQKSFSDIPVLYLRKNKLLR